ncbi:M23 family metallopeptidase [Teredinibacter waterburyi]|uniref:M23 family metallopeptidase n=1 Tax=Teredinibacter waterburyi TaxID=1500538 RepID=UPI001FE52DC7|nr:M23 family metallopeptidase [Teredinibacter waterburyi]
MNYKSTLQYFVWLLVCLSGNFVVADETTKTSSRSQPQDEIADVSIQGRWLPGALLRGQTVPGASVVMGKQKISVDQQGKFVFGLGRDVTGVVTLDISAEGSKTQSFSFPIESRQYDVQHIEGVAQKYVSPAESVLSRIKNENSQVYLARQVHSALDYYQGEFIWPAAGPVTGVYGSQRVFNGVPKRPHYGLDIGAPVGEPVVAPLAGRVSLVHADMYYSGGTLIIDHGAGVSSTFIHLSEILVNEGELVEQGQVIAKIGATGRATGPHLDWRVNWFQTRLDPLLLLPARQVK